MACMDEQQSSRSEAIEELLGHGSIEAQSKYIESNNTYVIFSWRIVNYSKLRHHILYYRLFENTDVKCVFKMLKTTTALYVCLRSTEIRNKTAQFYIHGETERNFLVAPAQEQMDGLYVGDFLHEFLLDDYVKNGMLTLSFIYMDFGQPLVKQTSPQKTDRIADLDEFCNDMQYMYLDSLHSDFTICVGDCTFYVHKFVLASRSKFFELFFTEHQEAQEYSLEAAPRIVHLVLVYVYSGEFKNMEMASLLEIYDVAHELGIDSLSEKCLNLIAEDINDANYPIISFLGRKLASAGLKRIANKYNRIRKKGRKETIKETLKETLTET